MRQAAGGELGREAAPDLGNERGICLCLCLPSLICSGRRRVEGQAPPTWVPGVVPVQDCPCSPSANGLLSRHHSFMSDPVVWLRVQMKPHFLLWDSKNENVVGAVLGHQKMGFLFPPKKSLGFFPTFQQTCSAYDKTPLKLLSFCRGLTVEGKE